MAKDSGTTLCADDHVWVCGACGKTSRTRYGFVDDGTSRGDNNLPDGTRVASHGWDASCMMHAVLCYRELRNGAWVAVPTAAELTSLAGADPHTL